MNLLFEINGIKGVISMKKIKKILLDIDLFIKIKTLKPARMEWFYDFNFKINGVIYNVCENNNNLIITKIS